MFRKAREDVKKESLEENEAAYKKRAQALDAKDSKVETVEDDWLKGMKAHNVDDNWPKNMPIRAVLASKQASRMEDLCHSFTARL